MRRLRGYCLKCGNDVATKWSGEVRVAMHHRATEKSWTPCKGVGRAVQMEPVR